MLCQDRQPVIYLLLAAGLFVVWSLRLLDAQNVVLPLWHGEPGKQKLESAFVQQAISVEFPAPINYEPIREVCDRTEFRPGLLFSCEGQHGGVGMVRNQILRCIRYAINAGAALVVPSMQLRSTNDISDIETSNEVPLENMFDREAFLTHLSEGCPGMHIYERAEDFPLYKQHVVQPLTLVGDQFEPDHPREGLRHPRQWRQFFDEWLEQQSVQIRPDSPVHIKVGQSFLEYPVRDDGIAFANEFGKILSFRNDTRAVAAKVLFELKQRFRLSIDPARAISPGAFYGAHLRLEEDAIMAWPPSDWRFSRMEDQFDQQFQNVKRAGLDIIYVASGNQTVVDMFSEDLGKRFAADPSSNRSVTVVTKHDLLTGSERRRLDSLSFDQQGLVDFLIMFKASVFMGVAHSSFPWNVALRRHELSRFSNYGNEGSDLLRDEYSIIMGMESDYPYVDPFVYGIWP